MTVWKRLFRKPVTTLLWLVFVAVMTGFLSAAAALWDSTVRLSDTLDKNHTAIAVRTDPAVTFLGSGNGATYSIDTRVFTQKDAEAIEALPGVKAVRSHTVAGCSSPALHPFIDVRRELSWRASGNETPYMQAVFAGKLKEMTTKSGMHPWKADIQNPLYLLFELDEILLMNEEYTELMETIRFGGGFSYVIDLDADPEAASYFVEGEHYVVAGTFDPRMVDNGWQTAFNPEAVSRIGPTYYTLTGTIARQADGYLEDVSDLRRWSWEDGKWVYDGEKDTFPPEENPFGFWLHPEGSDEQTEPEQPQKYIYPAAERYEGDPNAFFEQTQHELWRTYRDAWEKQNHSMVAIGTDRLETVFSFLTGEAIIIDGRSFTEEEYQTGAKVMLISEITANLSNLSVGDTVPLSQYPSKWLRSLDAVERQNNPDIDDFRFGVPYGAEEPFTVVGIYQLPSAWSDGAFSFTTNTVFMPRSAQIADAYPEIEPYREPTILHREGETITLPDGGTLTVSDGDMQIDNNNKDVYGLYLTVELINGHVDEFLLALEDSPYAGQFYAYDQGFEEVQKNLIALGSSTAQLVWIALGGWGLLLLLYLLMYQSAQKKNIGVMRSLGASPKTTAAYLMLSGMVVAAAGIALGMVLSRVTLGVMQDHVLSDMLSGIDRTAYGGVPVISEEALQNMVRASTPGVWETAMFAVAEFVVIGVAVWLHAAVLVHRNPRKLMED